MRTKYSVFALLMVLLLAVSPVLAANTPNSTKVAPQQDGSTVVIAPGETVKIGLATDLSNVIPEFGRDIANAAQLAVDLFNEEGGLLGFEVELFVQDDLCTGEGATPVANLFAADPHVVGVVGHTCSGASIPASLVYQDARIPMVSPSSTAGVFTTQGFDVVNRVAFNDNVQGVVVARYIYSELGLTSIAVLHDNSAYGKGLADTVAATFTELGGEVVASDVIDPDSQDYRSTLSVIAESEPELVYFGGYVSQGALLAQQMLETGLEEAVFFSDDGIYGADFVSQAGDAAEGVFASFGLQLGDPAANEEFDALYEETYGTLPDEVGPFHAQSFDSAVVLLNALIAVAEVDADGNLVIDREALILAVRSTTDLAGLSGNITCDENGDCGSALIAVHVVEDGEWVELEVPAELQVYQFEEMAEEEASEEAGS